MSKINDRLVSLKSFVTGIRFVEGISVIDVILKENWVIPKSDIILNAELEKEKNSFIFFTQTENIGIDEILDFIEEVIKLNIEREKKQVLFKEKVKELQEFFKKNKLGDLMIMKFVIDKEEDLSDKEEPIENEIIVGFKKTPEPVAITTIIESKEQLKEVFAEKPVFKENMTDEEREEEEAIARAEAFRKNKDSFKLNGNKIKEEKKKVIQQPKNINNNIQTCDCGDSLDKICGICADSKSL